MQWVGISGTWKIQNADVEKAVRREVRDILARGDGIVTGGALGVDFIAADEALKLDPTASQLKIILPTPMAIYRSHYLKRAGEGVITFSQANALIRQLDQLKRLQPANLVEMHFTECTSNTYYERNSEIVNAADTLIAFQINSSQGTQDTIDKARSKKIPVTVHSFVQEPTQSIEKHLYFDR